MFKTNIINTLTLLCSRFGLLDRCILVSEILLAGFYWMLSASLSGVCRMTWQFTAFMH